MKKALLAFAAILAIAVGCSKENFKTMISRITGDNVTGITRISAKILDSDARATLDMSNPDCYKQVWEEADCIAVTDINGKAVKFNYIGEDGSSEGEFEADEGKALTDTAINRYAVYPYDSFNSVALSKEGDSVTVVYPAQQTFDFYTGKAEGNNLMLAEMKVNDGDSTFYFKNVCAYMQLKVAPGDNGDQIRTIIIKSLEGNVINGRADVAIDAKTGEFSSIEFDERYGNSSSIIACYDDDNEGLDITGEPIIVAVPPISGGFSVTVVTCDGLSMTKESSTELEIGTFVTMPEFDFAGIEPSIEIPEEGATYVSFKEALEAANSTGSDCTIRLLSDCYVTGPAEFDNSNPDSITVDLNGYKLYESDVNRICVCDGTTLVIKGNEAGAGEIIQESADCNAVDVYGTLNVRSGKITAGYAAVKVYNGSFEMTGGELVCNNYSANGAFEVNVDTDHSLAGAELKGGKITSTSRGVYAKYYDEGDLVNIYEGMKVVAGRSTICASTSGSIVIQGGDYESTSTNVIYTTGDSPSIKVTGGWFYSPYVTPASGTITVEGECYFNNSNSLSGKIAEGFNLGSCEVEHDGKIFTVVVKEEETRQAVLTKDDDGTEIMTGKLTEVLKKAVEEEGNVTITLLTDAQCKEAVTFITKDRTVTLNLNGKTVMSTGSNRPIVGDGTFIIKSEDESGSPLPEGTMTQTTTSSYIVSQTGGELIIKNGNFIHTEGSTASALYSTGGDLTIEGGYVEDDCYRVVYKTNGKLSIKGGEIICNNSKDSIPQCVYLSTKSEGEFTGGHINGVMTYYALDGGEYKGCKKLVIDGASVDYIGNNGIAPEEYGTQEAGKIEVKSGTFNNLMIDAKRASHIVEITGGTFNGGVTVCADAAVGKTPVNTGVVNIKGGTFNGGDSTALVVVAGQVTIDGGTFTSSCPTGTVRAGGRVHINRQDHIMAGTITINENVSITATGSGNRAIYVGSGHGQDATKDAVINVNGATVKSEDRAIHMYSGTLNIINGLFTTTSESQPVLYCSATGKTCNLNITDCYFAGTKMISSGDKETSDITKSVFSGHYTGEVEPKFIKDGFACKADPSPVTIGGVTYTYIVDEDASLPDIVSVNGEMFKSFDAAAVAAKTYNGEGDVTLKLETTDTVEVASRVDLTNANGKKITFDLNGGVIKSLTDSLITATGKLDIKGGKLVSTSGKYKLLHVGVGGVVNTENCVFEDHNNYSNNNVHYYVICAQGTGTSNMGELHLKDGTKIIKASGWGYCLRVGYSIFTTEGDVEITGHANPLSGDNYGKGAPLVYAHTGGKITINDGASFYSPGLGNAYVINVATGNTNGYITINGGYFYGDQACIKESSSGYAKKVLTIKGGYFSHDFSSLNFMGGKTLTPCSVTHTHGGKELTYSFEAK